MVSVVPGKEGSEDAEDFLGSDVGVFAAEAGEGKPPPTLGAEGRGRVAGAPGSTSFLGHSVGGLAGETGVCLHQQGSFGAGVVTLTRFSLTEGLAVGASPRFMGSRSAAEFHLDQLGQLSGEGGGFGGGRLGATSRSHRGPE